LGEEVLLPAASAGGAGQDDGALGLVGWGGDVVSGFAGSDGPALGFELAGDVSDVLVHLFYPVSLDDINLNY
jgi:hypothetical protein